MIPFDHNAVPAVNVSRQSAQVGHIESFDVDEHAEALAPMWNVNFDQISPGAFHAELDFVRTAHLIFYRERWDSRLNVAGTSPAEYLMVGTTASANFSWHGAELGERNLAIKQSAETVDFSSCGSDHVVLLVGPGVLKEHLGEEPAEVLLRASHRIDCTPETHTAFLKTLLRLTHRCRSHPEWLDHHAPAIELELLELLVPHERSAA